jgi:hypothetical protein
MKCQNVRNLSPVNYFIKKCEIKISKLLTDFAFIETGISLNKMSVLFSTAGLRRY